MADDAQTVITLLTWTGTPPTATPVSFYATKDTAGNYTLQSTPRVMGAQVDAGNPMPVTDAAAETALAAIEISTAAGATAAGQASILTELASVLTKLQGTLTTSLAAGTNAIGSVIQTPSALTNSTSGAITESAAIVVPFSATRKWLMFSNRTTGTEIQDIGSSNVTVGGGIPIAPGGGFLFNGLGAAGPIYGITTVASSPFSYVEG